MMRPKKSVNDLEEALRESTPPKTAVPHHFRQQLRHDLLTQATPNTPSLSRRWLLAPVALLIVVIVAFWYGLPKTAVEPAVEINTTRPAATPVATSAAPLSREQVIQKAFTFGSYVNNKPTGGWLVEANVEAITATAVIESYDVALNRLGSFANADFGGSNIFFPESRVETVWFVQLVGRWQPFGGTADMIEPSKYVGVLVNPDTGDVLAAGSSTVPFLTDPILLSLAAYPPQDKPYFVEEGRGFWLVHAGSQLLAFDPRSPLGTDWSMANPRSERCLYGWAEANGRFIDPCSGDEWELDGTLNLAESTELWNDRNLDQYRLEVDGDTIIVHLDEIIFGATITIPESTPEPPLGTSDHPQTNFNAVIERTDALAETRQSFLSSQSGWLYIADKEYMLLDYKGEGTYINSTFTTEQMLSETWYHTLGDGSTDQFITRYTDANGLVTALTVFIDGYYVNFFGDTINQAPQKLFVIPNDAAWVRELLGEVQAYTANEPSVSAYGEQVGGRSRYSLQITTIYNVPLPAETNQWGQTITGDKVNYMFDIETGQLLSQENISVADSGERLVDFSRNFQAESWLTTLPDDLAFYLAQAQTRLNNSNLTWIAPTPTPDFNPALAQVSDTQYGITVSVLDVNDKQGEVAVMMTAQVDPSWGVDHAFPFFQTFISLPLLYGEGERPFTPTHASGEVVEVDETTGGWREGSTHYFAGELSEGEALWLEAAVELTGIHHVITLPLTLADAEVGQIWSLDWPISLGAAQLVLSEVVWEEGTADGTAQLRLTLVDNNPPDLTLGCLHIATTDPWQELCDNDERSFVVTVPTDKAVQLHLRANINVTGFELRWQP